MTPSPPHLTWLTEAEWPPKVKSNFLLFACQTLTVESFELEANLGFEGFLYAFLRIRTIEKDTMMQRERSAYKWMGSQLKEVIHLVWPFIPSPSAFPVLGSHNLTLLSILPVATHLSNPSHSTQRTQFECPLKVALGVSLFKFHNRQVLSPDPVAKYWPVGENEAQRIGLAWPSREEEQRVISLTRKTASGSQSIMKTSSVDSLLECFGWVRRSAWMERVMASRSPSSFLIVSSSGSVEVEAEGRDKWNENGTGSSTYSYTNHSRE